MPSSSDATSLLSALGVGGLLGTFVTLFVQGRTERMKTTIALVEGFSTLEAHKLRRTFWNIVDGERPPASLDAIASIPDDQARFAMLYVLNFFTTAGSLMIEGALVNRVFFSLAERWMVEILDKHLVVMCDKSDKAGPHRVHAHAIGHLYNRWRALNPSPRRRALQSTSKPPRWEEDLAKRQV